MGPRLIVRSLALCGLALVVMGQSNGGLFMQPPSATITYRGAEDRSLDMMVDQETLVESQRRPEDDEADESSPAATGSFRAAQDESSRVNWRRDLQGGWKADPVMLNRRQAGEPTRPNDDISQPLLGLEIRKEF